MQQVEFTELFTILKGSSCKQNVLGDIMLYPFTMTMAGIYGDIN